MEAAASEGENQNQNNSGNNNNNKNCSSNEGLSKPKRQMKTPFQLETLEKAYALETYPSESTRVELSEKLGLSDRQLQMWFCHRRLKDKKDAPPKKPRKMMAAALPDSPVDELRAGPEPGSDYGSGSGSGSSSHMELRNVASRSVGDDMRMMRRYYEPSQSVMELRAIACVEAQLGEPLREDGPILGIEFDPLPPDAFGAPIAAEQQRRPGHPYKGRMYEQSDAKPNKVSPRIFHDYPFLQDASVKPEIYGQVAQSHFPNSVVELPTARTSSFLVGNEQSTRLHGFHGHASRVRLLSQQDKQGVVIPSPARDDDVIPARDSIPNIRMNVPFTDHQGAGSENPYISSSDGRVFHNDAILRMENKPKIEEAKITRDAEAHEIRIRKELEKQDILRKKNEERMRKEMEKQDRERKKEEERLLRERQRELERLKREERREIERREKFLQKENLRAEKRRQKEELRKEKEAVRRQAAIEKATARKIARESMELIEDEQLELMEIATAKKGLSSIISLDHNTLQNLELFRDFMGAFPPKSVRLKRPFGIQPWINSEKNIGNLLMVWKFFITFADVLELWPFTLDEFVQAFHDCDSRLLGEIHITLLRLIIKDIEDVARTPSTGLGMNQNGAAYPGGGHPQIVEGAYAWGFDIRDWQRHLNPLTWPEVFRQLALSAGLGPQLKKRSIPWSGSHDNDEVKGCEDIVSTLRNGSAAENAFAVMQEKGLLAPRRSRHRLTPGTVKFAAFHVLSLEGSKGLTVLELADKIQKSGLRDLTTSKTPEASISVALTRDTKLFERIAPSTYRVRAPYRKDPIDAEEILSSARKKIQIFQNGFLAGEDADDVERDEESECDDVDEDPEVDDVATPSLANKSADISNGALPFLENGKEILCSNVPPNPPNEFDKDLSLFVLNGSKDVAYPVIANKHIATVDEIVVGNLDQENMEIDESKAGETWIQGLTEGDYFDLSVEERLNALVALTGIANEGNSIRVVLEDRLEAANALKKQMWAEAQLDKSRLKEEIVTKLDFPSFIGSKTEGGQSPLPDVDNRNNEASPSTAENHKLVNNSQNVHNFLSTSVPSERSAAVQDFSLGPDNFLLQQLGNASKRSRSQLKSYIGQRAEETYIYRSLPLGRDRRHNRYWQFVASASSNDPGSGRIFIELHDGNWRLIDSEEDFDTLLMSLDARGIRESHLRLMLQKIETYFKENVRRNVQLANLELPSRTIKSEADEMGSSPDCHSSFDSPSSSVCALNSDMGTSSSFRIELGKNENEKKAALKRYQDFQRWVWKECFNSTILHAMKYGKKRCKQLLDICDSCLSSYYSEHSHCLSCHQTYDTISNGFGFSEHAIQCEAKRRFNHRDVRVVNSSLPLGNRLLKALLSFIEASVPSEALQSFWTEEHRKTWGVKLNISSSIEELLQISTLFESAIKRDFLSSTFTTTDELLGSSPLPGIPPCEQTVVLMLPWIPRTLAAVALRLFELDASIIYMQCEKLPPGFDNEVDEYTKLPARYASQNSKENEVEFDYDDLMREETYVDLKNVRNKRGRGSLERGRGKKLQKRANGSKSDPTRQKPKGSEKLNQGLRQIGQGGRGRRTVRKRRVEKMVADETLLGEMVGSRPPPRSVESPRNFSAEWDDDDEKMDTDTVHVKDKDETTNIEAMDSDDDEDEAQGLGYEQENWELGFEGPSHGWTGDLMVASDEDVEVSEYENGVEEVGNEESENDDDDELSEDSDGIIPNNRTENEDVEDSAVSEDYSD